MLVIDATKGPVPITIKPEAVAFIIVKAREFDEKVDPVEQEPGSNATDDDERGVLEDYGDDSTEEELRGAIEMLSDDELIDLITLAWLGRGDFEAREWGAGRRLARERFVPHSADYLLGMPALGDYLEEGLAALGYSVTDEESQHL